jgi:tyrosyl-tRNA synthetase
MSIEGHAPGDRLPRGSDPSSATPVGPSSGEAHDAVPERGGEPEVDPEFGARLHRRGLVRQVTDDVLFEVLGRERVTLYAGFDPTASSLQLGNLVPVALLVRFARAGHRPIALVGGGTALVGDPSGKDEERPLTDREVVRRHAEALAAQLARFVEPEGGLVVDNAAWLEPMGLLEFLRDVGKHFTVNQMIAKESVRSRLEREEVGISFTEFAYMLLQARDFLELFDRFGCRLQVGASDQWGNITAGVELVRKRRNRRVWGLTVPLVETATGGKLGKTEQGTIWVDARLTSPYRLYQYLLRTEDALVGGYLRALTFLEDHELQALDEATGSRPWAREAQRRLAFEVTAWVHGVEAAEAARRASEALYGGDLLVLDPSTLEEAAREAPTADVSRAVLDDGGLSIIEALVAAGLVRSKAEARRALMQGGVYVNNERVVDPDATLTRAALLHDRYVVLRRGRRELGFLRFS